MWCQRKWLSVQSVCKVIHKHGFTHKKLQHDHYGCGEFMAGTQMYHSDCDCFVFIGYSSKNHIRKFG